MSQRGVALLLVLWVLVLLSVLAAEFVFTMRTEVQVTANSKEQLQAYYLAVAGVQAALRELMLEYQQNGMNESGELIFFRQGDVQTEQAGESLTETTVMPVPPQRSGIALGPGYFSYEMIDEDGKLNLNLARREAPVGEAQSPYQQLRNIFLASGVPDGVELDTIMDSILDWRDPNDEHRLNGAEDEWYEKNYVEKGLSAPYQCKNGPFDAIEELLLVRGVTPEIFYGSRAARQAAGETPVPDDETAYQGVVQYLSVYSGSHVSENTAAPFMIGVVYPDQAEEILTNRAEKGFFRQGRPSRTFTIQATGYLKSGPVAQTIRLVVRRLSGSGKKSRFQVLYWKDTADYFAPGEELSIEEVLQLRVGRSLPDSAGGELK